MSRHHLAIATVVLAMVGLALWTSISPEEPLSNEGVRFVARSGIFVLALLFAAFARTVVGHNKRRQFAMFMGTVGGMAFGVGLASWISKQTGTDLSALSALGGVFIGWIVAYLFIRHIPRDGTSQSWRTR